MIEIKRFDLDAEHYCVIGYDEHVDSPRNWGDSTKFCIRPHRRYSLPNELPFHFENIDNTDVYETLEDGTEITVSEHEKAKLKDYWIFELDCYEHSGITFSLSGSGTQCQFDTSKNCGFIAVPKTIEGAMYSEEEAKRLASSALETYNQWLNGEVYEVLIFKRVPPILQDGKTYTTQDDLVDSFGGVWNLKDGADLLDEKFKQTYLANI